jgi:RpiB/LacA/LacB family sugar-phosphate isomerase
MDETKLGNSHKKQKVLLGCDSWGEPLKKNMQNYLQRVYMDKYEIVDFGTQKNYCIASKVASYISEEIEIWNKQRKANDQMNKNDTDIPLVVVPSIGLLFCGTGIGVSVIANKFKWITAVTCENVRAAACARAINDANILCMGSFFTKPELGEHILEKFLTQKYVDAPLVFGDDGNEKPEWWTDSVERYLEHRKSGIRDCLTSYHLERSWATE